MSQNQPEFVAATSILKRLISIHQAIALKQEQEIEPKLHTLTGYIAEYLMAAKLQENIWLAARRLVAQEIRSLLEQDSRCLLLVNGFQQFVNDTVENILFTTVSESTLGSNAANWLILSLPSPVKLSNFRDCSADNGYRYSIELEVNGFSQLFQVPISPQPNHQAEDDWDVIFQWRTLTKQLEAVPFDFSGFEQSQQEILRRETSCLICYVAQLLHVSSQVNSFTYP